MVALSMPKYVINLDRSTDRMSKFLEKNGHLKSLERFPAVDGSTINLRDLEAQGLVLGETHYSIGALGNALSHMALWEIACESGRPVTIFEDDAIIVHDFDSQVAAFMERVPADWQWITWGWNFDAPLWAELIPGVCPMRLAEDYQDTMRENIDKFQTQVLDPRPFGFIHCFGSVGYSISPSGAAATLRFCRPLRPMWIQFRHSKLGIGHRTLDGMLNGIFPELKAYVSIPPLVLTENRHETSTVIR